MFKISLHKKYLLLLLIMIVPAFISLTHSGFFSMHDDIQGMRVLQMHKCILDLQIPCRWVPDMGYGYGYPQFNYYAPLPYYVMEVFVLLGQGILSSVKIGFSLSLILSALSMYLMGSKLWGKAGGLISALFYTYAPYRAADIYVRGAMGEAWAFVFLPLILLYTLEILENKKAVLPLALSLAGLALTHNISVIMFIPFYAIFVLLSGKINIKIIKNFTMVGIWAVLMSAFFVLPAFLEKEYVHVETILQGYFNYLAHYVGIKQLFFSTFWGYGASTLGPLDGMSLSLGVLIWSFPLVVLSLALYLREITVARKLVLYLGLAFFATFLIHPKSQIIWDNISILSYVQFPWRFLALAILFFALAGGAVGKLIKSNKAVFVTGIFLILVMFYGRVFYPSEYLDVTDSEKFSGASWVRQQTISIFDYLPKGAKAPPASRAPEYAYSPDATLNVLEVAKGTNWQEWKLATASESIAVFPVFNFPTWIATIDGVEVPITDDNDLGLITIKMPEGEHNVYLKLHNTPLRTISNIISLAALLLVPIYLKKYAQR